MFLKILLFFKQVNMDIASLLSKKVFYNFWSMENSKKSLNLKTVFFFLIIQGFGELALLYNTPRTSSVRTK